MSVPNQDLDFQCHMSWSFLCSTFDVRGGCLFCWYWWNRWLSLFELSFHNHTTNYPQAISQISAYSSMAYRQFVHLRMGPYTWSKNNWRQFDYKQISYLLPFTEMSWHGRSEKILQQCACEWLWPQIAHRKKSSFVTFSHSPNSHFHWLVHRVTHMRPVLG